MSALTLREYKDIVSTFVKENLRNYKAITDNGVELESLTKQFAKKVVQWLIDGGKTESGNLTKTTTWYNIESVITESPTTAKALLDDILVKDNGYRFVNEDESNYVADIEVPQTAHTDAISTSGSHVDAEQSVPVNVSQDRWSDKRTTGSVIGEYLPTHINPDAIIAPDCEHSSPDTHSDDINNCDNNSESVISNSNRQTLIVQELAKLYTSETEEFDWNSDKYDAAHCEALLNVLKYIESLESVSTMRFPWTYRGRNGEIIVLRQPILGDALEDFESGTTIHSISADADNINDLLWRLSVTGVIYRDKEWFDGVMWLKCSSPSHGYDEISAAIYRPTI